jgi:hypothetical protein
MLRIIVRGVDTGRIKSRPPSRTKALEWQQNAADLFGALPIGKVGRERPLIEQPGR